MSALSAIRTHQEDRSIRHATIVARVCTDMGKTITRAVVIEQDARRADTIVDGLRDASVRDVKLLQVTDNLTRLVATLDPHVVLFGMANL